MGLIIQVDMVCLSPVRYGVYLTFRALALRRSSYIYIAQVEYAYFETCSSS